MVKKTISRIYMALIFLFLYLPIMCLWYYRLTIQNPESSGVDLLRNGISPCFRIKISWMLLP